MPPQHLTKKRKSRNQRETQTELSRQPHIPPTAYIQAYEAQLVYGRQDAARALSQPLSSNGAGLGLIRWGGDSAVDGEGEEVWLDRHDILHLLPSLPSSSSSAIPVPGSPTPSSSSSWDSIPSDLEDRFFLSGTEEEEEYETAKKRRWLEVMREERVREREKEEEENRRLDEGVSGRGKDWGGDDEEPPPAILTLMSHTAKSLSTSPNPKLLEIRILTHHASDDRFSFLKGRYKRSWDRIKSQLRQEKEGPESAAKIGGLIGGYESSEGSEGADEPEDSPPPPPPSPPPLPEDLDSAPPPVSEVEVVNVIQGNEDGHVDGLEEEVAEEEKKRQRRLRAEEWKRKRAAAKGG